MFLAYEVIWFRCYSMMLITCITCVLLCEVKYRHLDTISAVLQCRLRFRPEKIVTIKFVFISKILCASNKIHVLPCMFSLEEISKDISLFLGPDFYHSSM